MVEFHRTDYPARNAAQAILDAGLDEGSALRLLDVGEAEQTMRELADR